MNRLDEYEATRIYEIAREYEKQLKELKSAARIVKKDSEKSGYRKLSLLHSLYHVSRNLINATKSLEDERYSWIDAGIMEDDARTAVEEDRPKLDDIRTKFPKL